MRVHELRERVSECAASDLPAGAHSAGVDLPDGDVVLLVGRDTCPTRRPGLLAREFVAYAARRSTAELGRPSRRLVIAAAALSVWTIAAGAFWNVAEVVRTARRELV